MKKLICALSAITILAACQKDIANEELFDEIAANASGKGKNKLNVGDPYQGGIVAYILQPGDPGYKPGKPHGLIAAPADQVAAPWGCVGTDIPGANVTFLGHGNQNTIDIVAGCPEAGIAARICSDLDLNGYQDWYLPSVHELRKLFENRSIIGNFSDRIYWSSTEIESNTAWLATFDDFWDVYTVLKSQNAGVRAIRSF